MKNQTGKRAASFVLVCLISFVSLTGFNSYSGLGTAYYESSMEIFTGAKYSEIISGHSANGLQHAHYVEADIESGDIKPIVFNGEVRGTYNISDMIRYASEQGYKVIAAINGDIYDMSSGTPKGLVIHGGNIVTSGYAPDRVIAFYNDGTADLVPAKLSYTLKGTISYQQEVQQPQNDADADNSGDMQTDGAAGGNTENGAGTSENVQQTGDPVYEWHDDEWNGKIDFFNVPQGAANGLHLYNRHYSSSTKTSGTCAEVVIECKDIQLRVNDTIKGTVKQVNTATNNTPISDNTVVLSTVYGSATYNYLSALKVGSEIEISVEDAGNADLENAGECIGIYYSLVENGRNVTSGTAANPRTALGIKEDGSIVLFELDGRQAAVSKGLGLYDLADAMIELGCETAVNLDGGGSSVIYVRQPGKDANAVRQSSPSSGSERKVANGILLAYKDNSGNSMEHLNVYPALTLAMPGAKVQLSAYASNELYEKTSLGGSVKYSVEDSDYGTVSDDGIFTAGSKTGKAVIEAKSGKSTGRTEVEIVDDIVIVPSVTKLTIEPGETRDINVTARVGDYGASVPVNSSDDLFTFKCDENIGTIDELGVFTASTSSAAAQSGNIYIEYNNNSVKIPVQVGAYIVEFADTAKHWAKTYIGTLAGMKILDGMGDNMFAPDGSLTRAQFVAMLAKMTDGADVSASAAAGFTDVQEKDWYCGYVNWGYENGIVNGMGDGTFSPNTSITREQMAVMLCNYARSVGFVLPQTGNVVSFSDAASVSSWATDYVATAAGAGIINGFDTGDFKPQGVATRAQAATVIYKMCQIRGIL
ncbi:MAG: hypothetical protein HFG67_00875 [Firmicutes bacterium]|nr:hypothetical protein [Bacillota bacterium]